MSIYFMAGEHRGSQSHWHFSVALDRGSQSLSGPVLHATEIPAQVWAPQALEIPDQFSPLSETNHQ